MKKSRLQNTTIVNTRSVDLETGEFELGFLSTN